MQRVSLLPSSLSFCPSILAKAAILAACRIPCSSEASAPGGGGHQRGVEEGCRAASIAKMTYWADNIKFIKDILESKYKKIDDATTDIDEHSAKLSEDKDNKKARDGFLESARVIELLDIKELEGLAETMFKDMPDNERSKEEERLKEYIKKYQEALSKVKDARGKYNIK